MDIVDCKAIASKITGGSTNGMHSLRLTWDELAEFASEVERQQLAQQPSVDVLVEAVRKTLDENGHLADGDVCTLYDLREALSAYEAKPINESVK